MHYSLHRNASQLRNIHFVNFTLQLFDWFKLDKGSFIWIDKYIC
jgi:hypothetical protein